MNEHVAIEETSTSEELVSHYIVEIAGELYGLPQSNDTALSWVQRPQEPTYLPTLPGWCLGLVNERNSPVLLVDPRVLLGMAPAQSVEASNDARHVFIERGGETIGVLVDKTRRFQLLPRGQTTTEDGFVSGVTRTDDGIVRVLNLEAMWQLMLHELATPTGHEAVA